MARNLTPPLPWLRSRCAEYGLPVPKDERGAFSGARGIQDMWPSAARPASGSYENYDDYRLKSVSYHYGARGSPDPLRPERRAAMTRSL